MLFFSSRDKILSANKPLMRHILLWTFLLFLGVSLCEASSNRMTLEVDISQKRGKIPYLYRTGVFLNSLPGDYPIAKFFKDQRPGLMEFSWDFYPELLESDSLKDFLGKIPSSNLSKWVKATSDHGGEVLIRLMPVPKWLWNINNGFRSPPKDYEGWAMFVEGIVDYFNNQLHVDARYVVWDEPDDLWQGTEADYFKLYKYSVLGVKRANKHVKIGGPATSALQGKINRERSETPLLYNFLRYCSKEGMPELGINRLPVDFVVWHTFDAAPISPSLYDLEVGTVKKWLKEFSYNPDTELNIGSWTILYDYPSFGTHVRDKEIAAAYVISSILAMDRAGIQRQIFFNLFEDWRSTDKRNEFIGEMGLFTRNWVIKPSYNALKILGFIQGERLDARFDDPFLSVVSSVDKQNIYLLISNFVPADKMAKMSAGVVLQMKGYKREDLERYGLNEEWLKDVMDKKRSIEGLQAPDRLKSELRSIVDLLKMAEERRKEAMSIEVALKNIPFDGPFRYERYLVDLNHSNGYSVREAVTTAVQDAIKEAIQKGEEYLSKKWTQAEIKQIKNLRERGVSQREILEGIPQERRKDLLEAQRIGRDLVYEKIDNVNEWTDVKLQKVEDYTIKDTRIYRKVFAIQPYSVSLIILQKSDK